MAKRHQTFSSVIRKTGPKPLVAAGQNTTRHYSETFSKELAHWLRDLVVSQAIAHRVMTPEEPISTIYGKKSLDVGAVDDRGYLVLDISIKTFNFRDKSTGNYRHNYTGRFYELLGEELDLRRSYRFATLAAIIFLPIDSSTDGSPSSFALAVKQFSKIATPTNSKPTNSYFDHVFVAVHAPTGQLFLFDASRRPPIAGMPPTTDLLTIDDALAIVKKTIMERRPSVQSASVPRVREYSFGPDRRR
jgi:hypothetical protein